MLNFPEVYWSGIGKWASQWNLSPLLILLMINEDGKNWRTTLNRSIRSSYSCPSLCWSIAVSERTARAPL